jgi:hypothetical protein
VNELQGARTIVRAAGVVLIKLNEMSFLDQHHPGRSYKVTGAFS